MFGNVFRAPKEACTVLDLDICYGLDMLSVIIEDSCVRGLVPRVAVPGHCMDLGRLGPPEP